MVSSLPLWLLAIEAAAVSANKVVSLGYQKHYRSRAAGLSRRQTVTATLTNEDVLYLVNVTAGTPAQSLALQIDTGSSDVWFPDSTINCASTTEGCAGGTFNFAASTSAKIVDKGGFNIMYVDGSGSSGSYFTDDFTIGGTTVQALEMGIATKTTIGVGILGIGFASGEAVCHTYGSCPQSYRNLPETLLAEGKIGTNAYSLWLDSLDATSGSILFGGVDTSRYTGDLIALPIQTDSQSGEKSSFTVVWSGLEIQTPSGTQFSASNFNTAVILDSGTSITLLPNNIAEALYQKVGASAYEQGLYVASCKTGAISGTFNFAFGGSGGPVIKVPIGEFFDPLLDTQGNQITSDGEAVCTFGIQAAGDNPILFGDTFLRSAYVVYDLTNQQIAIANTNFSPGSSNIKEITSNSIPGVSSTADGAAADATATGSYAPSGFGSEPTGSASITGLGNAQLTGAATSTGAAAATVTVASVRIGGIALGLLTVAFAGVGAGMLLL